MWLINTQTLALEYFSSHNKVPYAILSHTWEEEEVTFQEFHSLDTARSRKGFAKIAKTCSIAKDQGLGYAWVDTCCIDKENSAELSEAINSMFKWYTKAKVCLVFLSDLAQEHGSDWASCRWFTRGWTLQELIAPSNVDFYDAIWNFKGTKKGLLDLLSSITGIDDTILSGETRLSELPVARKMSWAATRRTSRDEDIAYCLMGLFDLNMPLLYGEGQKAFIRLQEQILHETRDLSLLAWTAQDQPHPYEDYEDGDDTSQQFRGIFASSPVEFSACGRIISPLYPHLEPMNEELTITTKALRANWPLNCHVNLLERSVILNANTETQPTQRWMDRTPRNFVLSLRCMDSDLMDKMSLSPTIVILLRPTSKGHVRTGFRKTYYMYNTTVRARQQEVYFSAPTHISPFLSREICSQYTGSLWLPDPTCNTGPWLLEAFVPPELHDPANSVFYLDGRPEPFRIYLNFSLKHPLSDRETSPYDFLLVLMVQSRGDKKAVGDRDLRLAFSSAFVPDTWDLYHEMLGLLRRPRQRAIGHLALGQLAFSSLPVRYKVESTHAAQAGELLLDIVRVPLDGFKLVDRPAKGDYLYSIKLEWKPASREGLGLLSQ